jgi:PLP dependent protein
MATLPPSIADNIRRITDRVASAAAASGRAPQDITLTAVSKFHPVTAVLEAIAAGQLVFGENRVQEATSKFTALRTSHPGITLHLIGPLQTNKVRDAMAVADVIETLDRPRLADAIEAAASAGARLPRLLVQVNTGDEPQKAGVTRADADAFIARCRDRFGASLTGLMCIPPAGEDPAPHFAWLADRAARFALPTLSMGMSADYETAIRHGATHIRVGMAIFGAR